MTKPIVAGETPAPEPEWDHLPRLEGGAGGVDRIGEEEFRGEIVRPLVIAKKPYRSLRIEGWAADTKAKSSGRGVFLVLENRGVSIVLPTRRMPRPDVAQHYRAPGYEKSGYMAIAWTREVPSGCYRVSVRVLASAANGYYNLPTKWVCFWEE